MKMNYTVRIATAIAGFALLAGITASPASAKHHHHHHDHYSDYPYYPYDYPCR